MAAEISCPICGGLAWEEGKWPLALREQNPEILRGGGVIVNSYFYLDCGYVRLHRGKATVER